MIKLSPKPIVLTIFGLLVIAFITSCGGVAKNPAEAPWKGKDQAASGTSSDGKSEEGAPVIREGASSEELIETAKVSLEGGFIRNAADAFAKILETDKEKPEAALGYAITKIAGSAKEFSLLMSPGIELLYYNTPLVGRPELLPTPLNDDDSYLLRVAALGTMYLKPKTTSQPNQQTPAAPAGVVKDKKDANKTPDGSKTPNTGETGSEIIDETGKIIQSTGDSERATQFVGERGGQQAVDANPFQQTETGGITPSGGTVKQGSSGGAMQFAGQGGTTPQYAQFTKDIFPQLLPEYRDIARTYNAGFINLDGVDSSFFELKKIVDDIIAKMEQAKGKIEAGKFALEIPFKLDKQDTMYRLYFRDYDYMIILAYMKLIQAELDYRNIYDSASSGFVLYNQISDKDNDSILTPSEYFPNAPYGMIKEDHAEKLAKIKSSLSDASGDLARYLDDFHKDDKLVNFAGNLIIPANVEQVLLDKIADERNMYSDFQVILTAGKGMREFKTPSEKVKIEINVANMFGENAPKSVSALLPSLNPSTFEPLAGQNGTIFPDTTWGGLFTSDFDNFDVFRVTGDIKGTLTYQGEPIKDVEITVGTNAPVKTDKNGKFTLSGISYNELVGFAVSVKAADIPTPVKAQIRGSWISFDLMVANQDMMGQQGGVTTGSTGGGETFVTPPTTSGGSSRIQKKIDETDKTKSPEGEGEKESEEQEQGEGGEASGETAT